MAAKLTYYGGQIIYLIYIYILWNNISPLHIPKNLLLSEVCV